MASRHRDGPRRTGTHAGARQPRRRRADPRATAAATTVRTRLMLSRMAESLYWIGRYVERAEDTSRILDVHLSLLIEDPWAPEDVVCGSLLAAMGRETDVIVGSAEILEYLAWDADDATSVAG